MGFAPYDKPKIAVCVYIENAGFGAAYGVPIGSLVMEKYLNGEIAPERKAMEHKMMTDHLHYDPPKDRQKVKPVKVKRDEAPKSGATKPDECTKPEEAKAAEEKKN